MRPRATSSSCRTPSHRRVPRAAQVSHGLPAAATARSGPVDRGSTAGSAAGSPSTTPTRAGRTAATAGGRGRRAAEVRPRRAQDGAPPRVAPGRRGSGRQRVAAPRGRWTRVAQGANVRGARRAPRSLGGTSRRRRSAGATRARAVRPPRRPPSRRPPRRRGVPRRSAARAAAARCAASMSRAGIRWFRGDSPSARTSRGVGRRRRGARETFECGPKRRQRAPTAPGPGPRRLRAVFVERGKYAARARTTP